MRLLPGKETRISRFADQHQRLHHNLAVKLSLALLLQGVFSEAWIASSAPLWLGLSAGGFQYRLNALLKDDNFLLEERFSDAVLGPAIQTGVSGQVRPTLTITGLVGFSSYHTGATYRYDAYELPNGSRVNAEASYRLKVTAYPLLVQTAWSPFSSKAEPFLLAALGATWLRVVAIGDADAEMDDQYRIEAHGRELQSWFIPTARFGGGVNVQLSRSIKIGFEAGYQWCHGAHDDTLVVELAGQVRIPARTRLEVETGGWYGTLGLSCGVGTKNQQ